MTKWIVAAMVAATALMGLTVASAGEQDPHKAYVCKYVGQPGVDESLQTGNNPIEVDTNALEGEGFTGTFPFVFTDQQGRSIAIGFVGDGFPVLTIEDCPTTPPPPPPPPPPTTTVTTPPPTHSTPPPACPGSVDLGPWYGDPRINIDLTGEGDFVVRGGIQRFSNTRVFRVSLDCDETLRIGRYKIKAGHYLSVYLDGVRVVYETPPAV